LFNKILIEKSVNGAEEIVKENGMYLLSTLKHEDTKIQASGAGCLGQLAKLGFFPETTDVIPLLAEMLKSEDIDARISSLECLSQMVDLKSGLLPLSFSITICIKQTDLPTWQRFGIRILSRCADSYWKEMARMCFWRCSIVACTRSKVAVHYVLGV
jgi:hypothetical protein